MTLSTTTPKVTLATNGAVVDFDFEFKMWRPTISDEILVTYDKDETTEAVLVYGDNYSLSAPNNDYSSGGTVTTIETYVAGHTITIESILLRKQTYDLEHGGPLDTDSLEAVLDRYIRMTQELALSGVTVTETTVSAFMATVLDDATPEEATSTLNTISVINVKNPIYGAVGDGVTDDTTALQAALTSGFQNNIDVYIPPGNYKITRALTVAVAGDDRNVYHSLTIIGAGEGSRIYQATADTDAFQIGGWGAQLNANVHVSDIKVGTVAGTGNAFTLVQIHKAMFRNVIVPIWGNAGFHLTTCLVSFWDSCKISQNAHPEDHIWLGQSGTAGTYGFYLTGTNNDCLFLNCEVFKADYGWYIDDASNSGGMTIIGGAVEGSDAVNEVYAENVKDLRIFGLWCEASRALATNHAVRMVNCRGGQINLLQGSVDLEGCYGVEIKGAVPGGWWIDADCQACRVDITPYTGTVAPYVQNSSSVDLSESTIVGPGDQIARTTNTLTGILSKDFKISVNETFEHWDAGVTLPIGWALTGTTTVAREPTTKKTGSYSVKVTNNTSSSRAKGISYTVPTAFIGQWISIECWMKISATSETGAIGMEGEPGSKYRQKQTQHPNSDPSTSWQRMTASFFYHTDYSTSMKIILGLGTSISNHNDTATVYIDNVRIWAQYDPYPSIIALADGATPSIFYPGSKNIFSSGGTTAITDFDDGYIGQVITFLAGHNITITDGTNIFLDGSANWAMTDTDTLTLIQKADGKWYEQSRGDNGA